MRTSPERNWSQQSLGIGRRFFYAMAILVLGGACGDAAGAPWKLRWEAIAERYREGGVFCTEEGKEGDTGAERDYGIRAGERIEIEAREGEADGLAEYGIYLQRDEGWEKTATKKGKRGGGKVSLEGLAEGFYRIELNDGAVNRGQEKAVYAIVSGEWKRDFLRYCQGVKEWAEMHADEELYRSSLLCARADDVMGKAAESKSLTGARLTELGDLLEERKRFEAGECPRVIQGIQKILIRRFEGGRVGEFVLHVPGDYEAGRLWAMQVHVDPRRWSAGSYAPTKGMLDLWWYSVSAEDLQWKEFTRLIDVLRSQLAIDADRMYLEGSCGNGIAGMAVALHHPDWWAEGSFDLGNSCRELSGNAYNLPLIFAKGGHAEPDLVSYYEFAVKCFSYYGCRFLKWSKERSREELRGSAIPEGVRESRPERVVYFCDDLRSGGAYWVRIAGREDENFISAIEAEAKEGELRVRQKNVLRYAIDIEGSPLRGAGRIRWSESEAESYDAFSADGMKRERKDEVSVSFRFDSADSKYRWRDRRGNWNEAYLEDGRLVRRRAEEREGARRKTERLCGPVEDVFTDRYIVAYGHEEGEYGKRCRETAEGLKEGAKCLADGEVTEAMARENHLALVGRPESNRWMEKVLEGGTPLQIEAGGIQTKQGRYEGESLGCVMICPNPLNPERYAAVFYGSDERAMGYMLRAMLDVRREGKADVGIYEVRGNAGYRWRVLERLNGEWEFQEGYERILFSMERKHGRERWMWWAAKAVKEEMGADVVLMEKGERMKGTELVGAVRYRDLLNAFCNVWVLKVRIGGTALKELVRGCFEGDLHLRKELGETIRLGLKSAWQRGEEGDLDLETIEEGKEYLLAVPERVLNGVKLGTAIEGYEIAGQDYLIDLLVRYAAKTKDVEADLEGIQVPIL